MLKSIFQSEYLKNIGTLLGGSVSAQLILLLISPILTRLFTPDDFGIFALFVAISSILGMIANGRYEFAILLPDKDEEGFHIFQLCLIIAAGFSVAVLFIGFGLNLTGLLDDLSLSYLWWLFPIAVFLQGIVQAFNAYLNRQMAYPQISKSRLLASAGIAISSIGFGWLTMGAIGLIFGKLFGQIIEIVTLYRYKTEKSPLNFPKKGSLLHVANKYDGFAKFSTFEGLFNTFFKQVPVFALNGFFANSFAGFYYNAEKVLGKPIGMTGGAVGQVFFQKAARLNQDAPERLRSFFLENLKNLALLILPVSIIVMLLSPTLFPIIFGAKWAVSGIYAKWLMPFFAVTFLKAPLSSIIDIKNKLKENLLFEIGFMAISILAFWIGIQNQSALLGIQLFSFGNAFLGLFQLLWFLKLTSSKSGF